jgi:hypothetical protein
MQHPRVEEARTAPDRRLTLIQMFWAPPSLLPSQQDRLMPTLSYILRETDVTALNVSQAYDTMHRNYKESPTEVAENHTKINLPLFHAAQETPREPPNV